MNGQQQGFMWQFVTLEVHDITDTDARGSEPIYLDRNLVGRATSGGFGWRINRSLALAMVQPELAKAGTNLEIKILDKKLPRDCN